MAGRTRAPAREAVIRENRKPKDGHDHGLPASLLAFVVVISVGLLAGIVLSYVAARSTDRRLGALEEYVQGRGEFRDAEADRMERQSEERIRQAMCDLLDQLPEGGLLERPRDKYDCGPGIPLSNLPPEQQELLRNQRSAPATSAPPAPSVGAATPLREGAAPSGPARTPQPAPEPSAPPAPPASSERPPVVDLGPLVEPVCESVRVCF